MSEHVSETPEENKINDDKLIPNVGDKRVMKQMGKVNGKDVELTFERKRNEQGGVDVVCHAPQINMQAKSEK